jgi:hypothetical protein
VCCANMSKQIARALIIAHGRRQPGLLHQAGTGIKDNYKALTLEIHVSMGFFDVCSTPSDENHQPLQTGHSSHRLNYLAKLVYHKLAKSLAIVRVREIFSILDLRRKFRIQSLTGFGPVRR